MCKYQADKIIRVKRRGVITVLDLVPKGTCARSGIAIVRSHVPRLRTLDYETLVFREEHGGKMASSHVALFDV